MTGVRFVAASYVVVKHYIPVGLYVLMPRFAQNIVVAGYVGVDLFFILSGFVLAYTYLQPWGTSQVDGRGFWAARFARIYPLYALSLLIVAPFWIHASLPWSTKAMVLSFGSTFAMLQAWSPSLATAVNFPAWSVSIEAFFYLTFPLLAVPFSRLGGRRLWIAAGVLWLASMLAPAFYAATNPDGFGLGYPDHYVRWLRVVIYDPLTRLPEFLLGVALGIAFLRRRQGATRAANDSSWFWLTVVAPVVILGFLAVSSKLPFPFLHNGLLAPLFGCLIYGLAIGRGPLAAFLGRPLLVLLGDASYAVYLLQDPLWNVMVAVTRPFVAPGSNTDRWVYYWAHPWLAIVFAVLLVGTSVALFPLFQEPVRRWLIRRLRPARSPAATVAA